jgi:hypothetical protein
LLVHSFSFFLKEVLIRGSFLAGSRIRIFALQEHNNGRNDDGTTGTKGFFAEVMHIMHRKQNGHICTYIYIPTHTLIIWTNTQPNLFV